MLLGTRNLTSGDVRRYQVSYRGFLAPGEKIKLPTVTIPAGLTSSIGAVSMDVDDDLVFFFVTGGSNLNEAFTATVQVQTTYLQTINDTIAFQIVSP